jgi:hypothetical protein
LRIASADDAKSVVRKYIVGTRSRHRKIESIMIDEEAKGPDEKGMWTVKGTYVTVEGDKQEFDANVTPRGEVMMIDRKPPPPRDETMGKRPSRPGRR